ncbi:DUF3545 family protein [Gallaecimonas kandeliae]|uniref:DUF3545 family protein n=1 Tax=Gallaecimonas kandeliae TaxID=3029055 RepID=UPI00264A3D1C|nr:DUF3545 family protein [Gallaecimonas kandeliae]WKE64714.1 DUF3545 family protein [Gallaecimonas kandeliae]
MDDILDLQSVLAGDKRDGKGRGAKKRKWREIENLKDRYRLKRELEDIDWNHDYSLETLEI